MSPQLETKNSTAVLATRDNIVPNDVGGLAALGDNPAFYLEGVDAATGASGVVTVDVPVAGSPVGAGDTGQLAAGEYGLYAEITHPSAAAANRQVLAQHRDAANGATLETLDTINAGAGKRIIRRKLTVRTNERIRFITGTDATNANIAIKVILTKLD